MFVRVTLLSEPTEHIETLLAANCTEFSTQGTKLFLLRTVNTFLAPNTASRTVSLEFLQGTRVFFAFLGPLPSPEPFSAQSAPTSIGTAPLSMVVELAPDTMPENLRQPIR